jgi:hypothetical protein
MKNKFFKKKIFQESKEKPSPNNLAVCLYRNNFTSVLYDPNLLVESANIILDIEQRSFFFEDENGPLIIKGIVSIGDPGGPCRGALKIDYIAGPGYGHILYPLAHAMSPNGIIIPDRPTGKSTNVSDDDAAAWRSSILKFNRVGLPLDDIDAHKSNPMKPHLYHTPEPEDDCKVHTNPERTFLNYAFPSIGGEKDLLKKLVLNHQKAMSKIPPGIIEEIKEILWEEADMFADRHLPPGDL